MQAVEHMIDLDDLRVSITDNGEGIPPWASSGPHNATTFQYEVHVFTPAGEYVCPAWGSIHDYSNGNHDHDGIGWMVLDELLSAASDPEEFWQMATSGDALTREQAKRIDAMLDYAASASEYLYRNQEAIEDHR